MTESEQHDDDQSSFDITDVEHDPIENFARQLDELCAATLDLDASDDEHDIPFGYEQLPQEDEDEDEYLSDKDEHQDMIISSGAYHEDEQDRSEANYDAVPMVLSLDPEESISEETSTMIKDIMKTISVPSHAVPDWAKSIPESSWIPKVKE